MATLKGSTIATTYDLLVKRNETYVQTGTNIELMTDSSGAVAPTGLYLESGAVTDNVGIGTAAPARTLVVYHASAPVIQVANVTTGIASDAGLKIAVTSDDASIINQEGSGNMFFGCNDSTDMTILANGNIGIGETSPAALLHIKKAAVADQATPLEVMRVGVYEASDIALALGHGPSIDFYVPDGVDSISGGRLAVVKENASDTNNASGMAFYTTADGGTAEEEMRITSDGKVGIGTTSPDGQLELESLGTDSQTVQYITGYNDQETYVSQLIIRKSHQDTVGLTTTLTTEKLGQFVFQGVDSGQNWDTGAVITGIQDGTAGNFLPTNLLLETYSATALNTNQLVLHNDGNVGIGETAPDANLCIGQGAGDGKALTFKSSDVGHAFTSYSVGGVAMEADTYGAILKGSPTNGGLEIQGTTEGTYRALILQGNLDGTPNNTHTASGLGAVEIRGTVEGSNTAGTIGSGKNILSIAKGVAADVTVFIVDADGNYWFDGAAQTAFDSYDDAHLIRAFDTYSSPNDIIQTKFDDFLKYKKSTLEDSGIIYKMSQEEKAKGQTPFICGTRLQKLHNGAIWQQYTELEKMKELMYDAMVELMGKEKASEKLNSHNIELLDKNILN